MIEIKKGQLVRSAKGRDCGRLYVVLTLKSDRLLLVDGQKRPIQKPKAKNIKHITPITQKKAGFFLEEPINDDRVIKFIKNFENQSKPG